MNNFYRASNCSTRPVFYLSGVVSSTRFVITDQKTDNLSEFNKFKTMFVVWEGQRKENYTIVELNWGRCHWRPETFKTWSHSARSPEKFDQSPTINVNWDSSSKYHHFDFKNGNISWFSPIVSDYRLMNNRRKVFSRPQNSMNRFFRCLLFHWFPY